MRFTPSPENRHSGTPPYLAAPNYSGRWIFAIAAAHFGVLALLSSLEASATSPSQTTLTVHMIPPAAQASVQTREISPALPKPQVRPIESKRKAVQKVARPVPTLAFATETFASTGIETSRNQETTQPPSTPTSTAPATPDVVTQAHFDAAYLQNPAPIYPALSRRVGEEGKVVLRVFVDANGRPEQIQLKTGSGSSRLDQAALDAVARWKFEPARRGTEAVSAWVLVPIVFNLRA